MTLVVVRCPACRGASRVDEPSLGLTVQCPRCAGTFAAIEEAELIALSPGVVGGSASSSPIAPPSPPVAPVRLRIPRAALDALDEIEEEYENDSESDDDTETEPSTESPAETDYDPHRESQGPLPTSVLIGLALLPFLIPILWLIGPALFGEAPMLSVAAPVALAVSVSVLCLAIIYTIDWTPTTRVKSVLILVGLSYFTGASLYFLKKELVDRVKKFFGTDTDWVVVQPPGADYQVKLPGPGQPAADRPLGLANLACLRSEHKALAGGRFVFTVGSGRPAAGGPNAPVPGTDAWFDKAKDDIVNRAAGTLQVEKPIKYLDKFPGREFEIKLAAGGSTRVVRIFYIKERVYYLAAEGPGMAIDHDFAQELFDSFFVTAP